MIPALAIVSNRVLFRSILQIFQIRTMAIELTNYLFIIPNTILLISAIAVIHFTVRRQFKMRQLRNIPGPKPIPFLGNSMDLIKSEST